MDDMSDRLRPASTPPLLCRRRSKSGSGLPAVIPLLPLLATLSLLLPFRDAARSGVHGFLQCPSSPSAAAPSPEETGSGIASAIGWDESVAVCPDQSTCCFGVDDGDRYSSARSYGCCPSKGGDRSGVCCVDDGGGRTGCAFGYRCATAAGGDGRKETSRHCELARSSLGSIQEENATASASELAGAGVETASPLMPRYLLCRLHPSALKEVHGLPVTRHPTGDGKRREPSLGRDKQDSSTVDEDPHTPQLAYYSNVGDILSNSTRSSNKNFNHLRLAIVVIHGSARNADEYLCSYSPSTLNLQGHYRPSSVLVIAPRFLSVADGDVALTSRAEPLRWADEEGDPPLQHAWRYGADSVRPSGCNVSSFAALDALVDLLSDGGDGRFPNLERIVVVGHSAGGQVVHRWALTSSGRAWGDGPDGSLLATRGEGASSSAARIKVRAVAANPRSFTYPDGRRFVNSTTMGLPTTDQKEKCPGYNQWQWGLDPGGDLSAPYKDGAIASVGGVDNLIRRYVHRDVVYLAGSLDILPLNNVTKGRCQDDWQGRTRFERSGRYLAALQEWAKRQECVGGKEVLVKHKRLIVEGVDHDHTLMFQSDAGLKAVFDPDWMLVDGRGEDEFGAAVAGR